MKRLECGLGMYLICNNDKYNPITIPNHFKGRRYVSPSVALYFADRYINKYLYEKYCMISRDTTSITLSHIDHPIQMVIFITQLKDKEE